MDTFKRGMGGTGDGGRVLGLAVERLPAAPRLSAVSTIFVSALASTLLDAARSATVVDSADPSAFASNV